jgi:hypothetical protein
MLAIAKHAPSSRLTKPLPINTVLTTAPAFTALGWQAQGISKANNLLLSAVFRNAANLLNDF